MASLCSSRGVGTGGLELRHVPLPGRAPAPHHVSLPPGVYTARGANWAARGRPVSRRRGVCITDRPDDPSAGSGRGSWKRPWGASDGIVVRTGRTPGVRRSLSAPLAGALTRRPRRELAMHLRYQLMKTRQDERLRAAARDHLIAEARRARTAGCDHAAATRAGAAARGAATMSRRAGCGHRTRHSAGRHLAVPSGNHPRCAEAGPRPGAPLAPPAVLAEATAMASLLRGDHPRRGRVLPCPVDNAATEEIQPGIHCGLPTTVSGRDESLEPRASTSTRQLTSR